MTRFTFAEQVDARKRKYNAKDAVKMARAASQLWIARGKSIRHFNMKKDDVTNEELAKRLTGTSGTRRAPTPRRGKKLFVGVHSEELRKQMFGSSWA